VQNYVKYKYRKNFSIFFSSFHPQNIDLQDEYFIKKKIKTTFVNHFFNFQLRNS